MEKLVVTDQINIPDTLKLLLQYDARFSKTQNKLEITFITVSAKIVSLFTFQLQYLNISDLILEIQDAKQFIQYAQFFKLRQVQQISIILKDFQLLKIQTIVQLPNIIDNYSIQYLDTLPCDQEMDSGVLEVIAQMQVKKLVVMDYLVFNRNDCEVIESPKTYKRKLNVAIQRAEEAKQDEQEEIQEWLKQQEQLENKKKKKTKTKKNQNQPNTEENNDLNLSTKSREKIDSLDDIDEDKEQLDQQTIQKKESPFDYLNKFIEATDLQEEIVNVFLELFHFGFQIKAKRNSDDDKVTGEDMFFRLSTTNTYILLNKKFVDFEDEQYITTKLSNTIIPIDNIIDIQYDLNNPLKGKIITSKTTIQNQRCQQVNFQIQNLRQQEKNGKVVDYGKLDYNEEVLYPDDYDTINLIVTHKTKIDFVKPFHIWVSLMDTVRILQKRRVRRPDMLYRYYCGGQYIEDPNYMGEEEEEQENEYDQDQL